MAWRSLPPASQPGSRSQKLARRDGGLAVCAKRSEAPSKRAAARRSSNATHLKAMREEQTISPSGNAEATAISWTGGKDCNLALLSAWRDPTLNVTTLVVFAPKGGFGFHAHPIRLMEAQAEALGLTLRIMSLPSDKPHKEGYIDTIRHLRDENGITVLGTGDMDLVGAMSTNWIDDCCQAVGGIRAYLPLWKADRITCLNTLVSENFHVVYSCVKQPWFDKSWVGRRMDEEAIQEMKQKSTDSGAIAHDNGLSPEGQKLDMGGENGEYHTMCLGGPVYSRIIELEKTEPKEFQSEPAKEGELRWWTYDSQKWWTIGEVKIQA